MKSKSNPRKQASRTALALSECCQHGWRFEEVFRYQFRISKLSDGLELLSDAWTLTSFAEWRIEFCPDLAITRVVGAEGNPLAIILGVAISEEGQCLPEKVVFTEGPGPFEQWLESLSGRFVAIADLSGRIRFYLDAAGNLSAVYDPEQQVIASSVHLAVHDEIEPQAAVDAEQVLQGKERFLFGETRDKRITRARPNHFIELRDFTEHRHWPRDDTPFAELDRDRGVCIGEISDRLGRNVAALAETYGCGLPVTAGMDSRIILASATASLDKIRSLYCYRLNRSTLIDADVAVRLAEQVAMPMLILSRRSPAFKSALPAGFAENEHRKMIARTGGCFAVRKDWANYIAQTPKLDVVLRGTGLEMTRANKWSAESASVPCNAVNGLRALTGLRAGKRRSDVAQARYDSLLERYESWAASLPSPAHERLYDIAHVELMLPAGPVLEYSAYAAHFVVNPFNSRRLYQLAAGIAPVFRMQKHLVQKLIAMNNRHLLNIPFHRDWPG